MTNTERQREFRKRNPGYYGRLKARQRAAIKRSTRQKMEAFTEQLRQQLREQLKAGARRARRRRWRSSAG